MDKEERMKIRNTIILLIIAILIGGYIYLYESKQLTTEEKKERAGKVFEIGRASCRERV